MAPGRLRENSKMKRSAPRFTQFRARLPQLRRVIRPNREISKGAAPTHTPVGPNIPPDFEGAGSDRRQPLVAGPRALRREKPGAARELRRIRSPPNAATAPNSRQPHSQERGTSSLGRIDDVTCCPRNAPVPLRGARIRGAAEMGSVCPESDAIADGESCGLPCVLERSSSP